MSDYALAERLSSPQDEGSPHVRIGARANFKRFGDPLVVRERAVLDPDVPRILGQRTLLLGGGRGSRWSLAATF